MRCLTGISPYAYRPRTLRFVLLASFHDFKAASIHAQVWHQKSKGRQKNTRPRISSLPNSSRRSQRRRPKSPSRPRSLGLVRSCTTWTPSTCWTSLCNTSIGIHWAGRPFQSQRRGTPRPTSDIELWQLRTKQEQTTSKKRTLVSGQKRPFR